MGRKCFVPYCNSGYSTCNGSVTMFSCPNDPEIMKKWSDAVLRQDRAFRPNDCICEKHFKEEDIIRHWRAYDKNGKEVMKVAYKRIRLRDGAVPCYFPSNKDCYCRKKRRASNLNDSKLKRILAKSSEEYPQNMIVNPVMTTSDFSGDEKNYSNGSFDDKPIVEGFEELYDPYPNNEMECAVSRSRIGVVSEMEPKDLLARARLFEELWKDSQIISLPSKSWAVFQLEANHERKIVITQMGLTDAGVPVPVKQICLDEEMNAELYLKSTKLHCEEMNINLPKMYTVYDISSFVQSVDGLLDWE
ncbi:uncharacterized protein [Hetaerina americana]|uniref:uncharacterized protein n=1 Tax=Hetaerina americana TaxID=62018 RepID=UPI003A7F1355